MSGAPIDIAQIHELGGPAHITTAWFLAGMIGQGLRVLVLVTTNERITKLHPAVSRRGRCASKILFGALPIAEAREWLAHHAPDLDHPPEWEDEAPATVTIADLFAIRAGATDDIAEPAVGFV